MGLALIVYGVFATTVLVFCTVSRVGPQPLYIGISMERPKALVRKGRISLSSTAGHGMESSPMHCACPSKN
jgi:hypothetical protein